MNDLPKRWSHDIAKALQDEFDWRDWDEASEDKVAKVIETVIDSKWVIQVISDKMHGKRQAPSRDSLEEFYSND